MLNFNMASLSGLMEGLYKQSYDAGFYTKDTIASFVESGTIGADAYKRITGDDYEARSV